MKKLCKSFLIYLFSLGTFFIASAQPISIRQIDSVVEKTLKTFDVPGIAVAVVKDGQVVLEKGYGLRSLNSRLPVDEHTLFGIASNSKAFTTAALAILVDEDKLSWDDKVRDHIPEFKMYNPYVTEEFTIRDLLTHRSGLGLGAGDLMFWPDSNSFTVQDIIHNLRYLKPVSGFRTKYDYDNLMYILAGEVVKRVSGTSWEDFISKRIMQPLDMTESAPSFSRLKNYDNVIDPHAPVDGTVKVIRRDWSSVANSAGGIYSNVHDMSKWIIMQMNNGKYGEDLKKQLFSEKVHQEMWTPQTIITGRNATGYNTHFTSYGLGWALSDVAGYMQATHTGGLAGIVTQVTLIPELKLGIIVFTNQQSGAAFNSVTNSIKDAYLQRERKDWIGYYKKRVDANETEAKEITTKIWSDIESQQKSANTSFHMDQYTGTYNDPWFGNVVISKSNGKLLMRSEKSFLLTGELFPYKSNKLIVKWNERSFDADAYVTFSMDDAGHAMGIKMKPISPLTDFSFDFQDLDFQRVVSKDSKL